MVWGVIGPWLGGVRAVVFGWSGRGLGWWGCIVQIFLQRVHKRHDAQVPTLHSDRANIVMIPSLSFNGFFFFSNIAARLARAAEVCF